jgi:hypothetical protein
MKMNKESEANKHEAQAFVNAQVGWPAEGRVYNVRVSALRSRLDAAPGNEFFGVFVVGVEQAGLPNGSMRYSGSLSGVSLSEAKRSLIKLVRDSLAGYVQAPEVAEHLANVAWDELFSAIVAASL